MTEKTVKMMVVGVGALGRHHARILSGLPGVELCGVADPNQAQGEAVANAHGTRWVADYRDLIEQCDAVSIVAPTKLHHQITIDCIQYGCDVLVEKPLTADVSQAEELQSLALANDVILQVGHIERFNPAFEVACEALTSVPRYIRAERLSPFPFRSLDIGVVHDLMIHDLELVLHLTGRMPDRVQAIGTSLMGPQEDTVQARLTFPGNVIADLTASRVEPAARRAISIWSHTETISCDLHTRTVSVLRPTEELLSGPTMEQRMRAGEPVDQLKSRVFGEFIENQTIQGGDADALTAELSEFVDAVRTRKSPRVDGSAGLQAVKVAELVLESLEKSLVDARKEAERISHAA